MSTECISRNGGSTTAMPDADPVEGPRSSGMEDGAAFAREYLYDLRNDPRSVVLEGWIDDIKDEPLERREAFAGVLQAELVRLYSKTLDIKALAVAGKALFEAEDDGNMPDLGRLLSMIAERADELYADLVVEGVAE